MTDHRNKYSNDEKIWNIVRTTKMWHGSEHMLLEKMATTDLPDSGLSQTFNLWETQYL